MHKHGFTLIELLVVIAIIGILASVILVSLGNARGRGGDSAVQSNLNTIRTQAEIYADTNINYGGVLASAACPTTGATMFFADTTIRAAITSAKSSGGGTAYCAVGTGGNSYAVAAQMRSDTTKFWCIDSNGVARQPTTAIVATSLGGGASASAACPQ